MAYARLHLLAIPRMRANLPSRSLDMSIYSVSNSRAALRGGPSTGGITPRQRLANPDEKQPLGLGRASDRLGLSAYCSLCSATRLKRLPSGLVSVPSIF